MTANPLGKKTNYKLEYSAQLLFALPRAEAREAIGLGADLPFSGSDLWNAWELTWLDPDGKPVVATAEFTVDADSPNIIESKSLKLYLNSLAMTRYAEMSEIEKIIAADLSATAGADVQVNINSSGTWSGKQIAALPGACIDHHAVQCDAESVDPELLVAASAEVEIKELHSHLLRSNCPVTGQPDVGSVLIRYSGPKIDETGLLRYLVSYRQHNAFHEACVERIFVDILTQCAPRLLTVDARYNRRGGLDINPFRSNFESPTTNRRLWRQ